MYRILDLTNYISLESVPSSFLNCYEEIKKEYHSNWLNEYDFPKILAYYKLDSSFQKRFYEEIELLKQDDRLNIICFIMYYILFLAGTKDYYDIWSWKSTNQVFKHHGSYMIPVVALLCGYTFHMENMKKRNFSEEQIEIQKYNIRLTCISDYKRYHLDGIRFSQMIWGSFFMKGYLIQVGRLQYEVGVKNFDKLNQYFKEKSSYIYIHIPRGEDLKECEVEESLQLAEKDIKKYYPELTKEKLVYYTQSWLLSPEVKEILPTDSNIMKFQNKFDIIEYEENKSDFLNFVFGKVLGDVNYKDLPEKTKLQKELKKRLQDKKKLHLGLGILKKERG